MANPTSCVIVYVTYQGAPDTRFDRDYYVERHLPLVMHSWQAYGLESAVAFFPVGSQTGTIVICECRFRNEDAIDAAFSSAETLAVMADVSRFTDVAPVRSRAVPR